jgi:catechol 2,3-dioxygenase-like lactoylglutathione lyase family enzyme
VDEELEPIESISAVTLLTIDMDKAASFYHALGFHVLYGGPEVTFTSFRVGAGYLNLQLDPTGSARKAIWGRIVFWVENVDAMYQRVLEAQFVPEIAPTDAHGVSAISTSATRTATS